MLPNLEQLLVLTILLAAVVLFIWDKLRVDVVAMLVLITLVITGLLDAEAAFSGFASPAVVTVWAVFIVSGALYQTGVADSLARQMMRFSGDNNVRLLTLIMITVGVMSAFMNNVGAVAILMPAVITISRQRRIPPSKLLMPLAFAALLGGNMTLIGTPPNILASTILQNYGQVEPFAFFDFLPTGVLVLAAGIFYMLLVGNRLLPERTPASRRLSRAYPIREYLTEVEVMPGSPLVGRGVAETSLGKIYDLNILQIQNVTESFGPQTEHILDQGDVLLVHGPYRDILKACEALKLRSLQSWLSDDWQDDRSPSGMQLAEIALTSQSRREGQTLREMDFRSRYGLTVLAIRHNGRAINSHLADIPLQFGDALLIQGPPEKLELMRENPNFVMLDIPPDQTKRVEKAPLALAILAIALIILTFGLLDVATTLVGAAFALVVGRVLSMEEAYTSIDWQSVFLIAGMLPLGIAMEETGTAKLLADQIVDGIGVWGPLAILGGMFVLTTVLTSVISNAAATVLMVPIAIDAALRIGASPQPFVMTTVIAASTAFLMPVGHQVNIIIFGPGGYKFSDYFRVGLGLAILLLVLVVTVLPLIWPLYPVGS